MKKRTAGGPQIRFHHIGIVVKSISEAIEKYATALGVDRDKIEVEPMSYMSGKGEFEEFKYAFVPLAQGENNFVELVEPTTPGPTSRYLDEHGEGLFHLALESSNIIETVRKFEKIGIPLAGTTPTEETLSVFFNPKSAHGVLIQVIKKGIFDSSGRLDTKMVENEGS